MSLARWRILERLRRARPEAAARVPDVPVRSYDWSPAERLERFRARIESVRGEVQDVGADWPQRLYELLRARDASSLLYGPDGPNGLELESDWPDSQVRLIPYSLPLESCRDDLFRTIDAGFTSCRGAVAETGSLVLWSSPQEPRLLSLVPPVHFVLLQASAIYSTFHQLMDEQAWSWGMPSNALLISGPSKSADIEQTLAYGVHGPKEVVVLVRQDASSASG